MGIKRNVENKRKRDKRKREESERTKNERDGSSSSFILLHTLDAITLQHKYVILIYRYE